MKHRKGRVLPRTTKPQHVQRDLHSIRSIKKTVQVTQAFAVMLGLSVSSLAVANMAQGTHATFLSQSTTSATMSGAHDFPAFDNAIADKAEHAAAAVAAQVSTIKDELASLQAISVAVPASPSPKTDEHTPNRTGDLDEHKDANKAADVAKQSRAKLSQAAGLLKEMQQHLENAEASLSEARSSQAELDDIVRVDQQNYESAQNSEWADSFKRVLDWASAADNRAQSAVSAASSAVEAASKYIASGEKHVTHLQATVKQLEESAAKAAKAAADEKDSKSDTADKNTKPSDAEQPDTETTRASGDAK